MKAIWKGTVSFGLVSIPIKLYAAAEQKQTIGFHLICKKCQTRVYYEKHCEGCKGPLEMDDIVRGLEVAKGQYMIFTDEELEKLKPAKSDRIEIKEFINEDEIDPIYFYKSYFCVPQKAGDRAYFLFKDVLKTSDLYAIGRFVMREKEYTCSIRSFKKGLLLTTLHYKYEVRDIDTSPELAESPKMSKEELSLAGKLVDQLFEEEFKMEEFKDTFGDQVREMIKKKDKKAVKDEKPEKKGKIKEKPLLDILKASLEG